MEEGIYDHEEYEKAMAWTEKHCKVNEGDDFADTVPVEGSIQQSFGIVAIRIEVSPLALSLETEKAMAWTEKHCKVNEGDDFKNRPEKRKNREEKDKDWEFIVYRSSRRKYSAELRDSRH